MNTGQAVTAFQERTNPSDVLVATDDLATRKMLASYFAEHDVLTRCASNRAELSKELAVHEPSLIILERQLGRDDGLDLLRSIRAVSDVPVIIASARRPEEIDRVVGLELGADDYVTKPYDLRELLARIRAIHRRHGMGRVARVRDSRAGGYTFGGWRLELKTRRLTDPAQCLRTLSHSEFALLVAFLEAPQRPLSREHLLQATRVHEDIFARSIDVQVLRLRRKLEAGASSPTMIRTERGVGYTFTLPVETF